MANQYFFAKRKQKKIEIVSRPGLAHPDVQDVVVVAHCVALIVLGVVVFLTFIVQAGGGRREDPGVTECIRTFGNVNSIFLYSKEQIRWSTVHC